VRYQFFFNYAEDFGRNRGRVLQEQPHITTAVLSANEVYHISWDLYHLFNVF
jgi:hypothetical protein